ASSCGFGSSLSSSPSWHFPPSRSADKMPAKSLSGPDLEGKTVVVVGLGASGRSAVELLLRRGARVIGTDSAPLDKVPAASRKLPCELVLGGHAGVDFQGADLIV